MIVTMTDAIPAYAVAYLRDVQFGDDVVSYMSQIDDTMTPFGGEFLIHGGDLDVREGYWDGTLVVIRFPDHDSAVRWYESAEYQRILPLRSNNSTSMAALVDGVKSGHTGRARVAEILAG
jgi:uncharacterized protein (DUF1330 family)